MLCCIYCNCITIMFLKLIIILIVLTVNNNILIILWLRKYYPECITVNDFKRKINFYGECAIYFSSRGDSKDILPSSNSPSVDPPLLPKLIIYFDYQINIIYTYLAYVNVLYALRQTNNVSTTCMSYKIITYYNTMPFICKKYMMSHKYPQPKYHQLYYTFNAYNIIITHNYYCIRVWTVSILRKRPNDRNCNQFAYYFTSII